MASLSQVDWKHDVNWSAIYQAELEYSASVQENLAAIANASAPYIYSPEFIETWESFLKAPEIQAAVATSMAAWGNFEANDGPEMLALGLYYSAMNTPEVAQVVKTVQQIAATIDYQIKTDTHVVALKSDEKEDKDEEDSEESDEDETSESASATADSTETETENAETTDSAATVDSTAAETETAEMTDPVVVEPDVSAASTTAIIVASGLTDTTVADPAVTSLMSKVTVVADS